MKKLKPMLIVFMIGLVLGILWPNLHGQTAEKINGLSELLLLEKYLEEPLSAKEYFFYLLGERGVGYLLGGIFGISIFGIPMSILWVGGMGVTVGAILASVFINTGLWGFLLGAGLLLPQYLIYIPASLYFFSCSYEMSYGCWKNKRYTWKDYRRYGLFMVFVLVVLTAGFWLEAFVNPMFLKFILGKMNFF